MKFEVGDVICRIDASSRPPEEEGVIDRINPGRGSNQYLIEWTTSDGTQYNTWVDIGNMRYGAYEDFKERVKERMGW